MLVASLALVAHLSVDPAQRLYNQFQSWLKTCKSVVVVVGDETYKFMGQRYRLDSPPVVIVCDGNRILRIEHDKLIGIKPAPKEMPDDMWLRGFEAIEKGPWGPECTGLMRTKFAGHAALSVSTRYSESPIFSSNLFFDAKTKVPIGYRTYSYGQLESEVIYTKVNLDPHLKPSDFA